MGQLLHGSARTTEAVRRAIQHSQASLNALAAGHGINPKTVAKWRKRGFAHDDPMGPKEVRSTVLEPEEEVAIVAFRKYTLLPLDDCLYALQPSFPQLTRSRYIGVCNGMAFPACRRSRERNPRRRNSRPTPLATSMSILLKFKPMKVGCIFLWRL